MKIFYWIKRKLIKWGIIKSPKDEIQGLMG